MSGSRLPGCFSVSLSVFALAQVAGPWALALPFSWQIIKLFVATAKTKQLTVMNMAFIIGTYKSSFCVGGS